ncbi:MAG: hypothetical protein IPI67_25110 [Myxococcales bacterium]|nr:hypothetical protein [Myxococcales bacterium]
MFIARLLAVLVTGSRVEREAVLHDAILLRLADGTLCQGRALVLSSLERGGGATYRVIDAGPDSVSVALQVPDVPGHLEFTLRGEAVDGKLIAVHVEV